MVSISASVGIGLLLEQRHRRQDLSGLAIAALRHIFRRPGRLHRMRLAVDGQALDSGDGFALRRGNRGDAGTHRLVVDHHRTGAALGDAAAIFGAGEADFIAQRPEQRHFRLGIQFVRLAINVQCDHGFYVTSSRPPNQVAAARLSRCETLGHYAVMTRCFRLALLGIYLHCSTGRCGHAAGTAQGRSLGRGQRHPGADGWCADLKLASPPVIRARTRGGARTAAGYACPRPADGRRK